MKIGLVGSTYWLNESLKRITADFPDITFIPFPYTKLIELPSLMEGEQAQCDYFLFLGETARRWTAKHLHPIVPWYGIPRSSSAFLRILAKASYAGYPPRFITDFQNPDFFRHALDEAGISPTESYIRYISYGSFTAEGYMEKNAELMKKEYQKGKAAFCTTIFITTYEILKKEHIPVYYMLPSFEDIRHTVQELITSNKVENSLHHPLSVISITIDAPSSNLSASISPHDLLRKKLSAAQYIYDFAFQLQGSCQSSGTDSFTIFTTYQPLEAATHGLTKLDLLRIMKENTDLTLSVGIGYGLTFYQAELCSKKAWHYASEHQGNCAFFVGEKGSVIGPILQESAVPLKESQEYLTLLSKRAGINFQYLQIMSNLCIKEHRNTFTPAELADASGIRKRTMNRILLKLIDIGCCIEKGKNYPKQRGRPSRIIELHLESPPTIK